MFKFTNAVENKIQKRRIVLAGGSGHVGRLLAKHFHGRGDDVTVLSRSLQAASWRTIQWDGRTPGEWTQAVDGADVVINLAGRSVNCRYTAANRREITASRVDSTRAIGQAIAQAAHPPKLWLNASTATIYRHALDRPMDEAAGELGGGEKDAPSTWRFSIDVAKAWEQVFYEAATPHTRRVALRSAMIMSPDRDGIFDTLRKLVALGLGGQVGSGKQFISWIHETDFVNAIEFLIANSNDELEGSINVCSPSPLPNREFMANFRRAYGAPIGLPASRWMLELGAIFLRTETELILKSRRVVPGRLLEAGFEFSFPEWPEAVADLVRSWRSLKS